LESRTTSVYGMSYELDPLATPDWGTHVQRDCSDSKEKNEIEANVATRTHFEEIKIEFSIPKLSEDLFIKHRFVLWEK
jgi:hypothetical protein